jgi:regulator of protease activity HflC (stomatin/prohibitin superfamily)
MITIAFVVVGIALFWWALWIVIAVSKKDAGLTIFLLATGALWAVAEVFLALAGSLIVFALLVVPIIILAPMLRIVTEYERGVLFRLGRQKIILGPGLNLVFPLGIDLVRKIDLRTFTIDVPQQEVITKDNVPAQVDAVVKVASYVNSTSLLAQTILRSVLGEHDLDEMLSKREELNHILRKLLDEATDPWGIKVTAVEIKAVELPESMKRAMARQAEAERERRAKVIAADGEYQASEKLTAAAKIIGEHPAAIQLRYLQTLAEISVEKNSTVLFPLPMELLRFFDSAAKEKAQT